MTVTPHPYRAWVDENDVGNTCCLAPRTDPIHTKPRVVIIDVRGQPHPQGSMKTHALPSGKVAVRYPGVVWNWRYQVQDRVAASFEEPFTGPVEVKLGFELPRPQDHYHPVNTKRSLPELKQTAPTWPALKPDIDKLSRAVLDAITDAGLWKDDAQVCSLRAAKRYALTTPGVYIVVTEMWTPSHQGKGTLGAPM